MDRPRSACGRVAGGRVTTARIVGCGLTSGRVTGRLAPLCAAAALASITLAACGSSQASGTASGVSASPTAAASVAGSSTATSPAATSAPAASPGAASPGITTQAALCRDTASVTGLKIVRNQVVRVPVLQVGFPGQVTVASPAGARAVARALCALPPMPRAVFGCPALLIGTTYQLGFTAGGRRLPPVTIEATGCEVVTGVGPTRWATTSPGFWRVLATAAHLGPAGRSAFSGGIHTGPICDPVRREQANDCPARVSARVQPARVQPGGVAVP